MQQLMGISFFSLRTFFSGKWTSNILAWHIQIQPPPGLQSRGTQYVEIKTNIKGHTYIKWKLKIESYERNIYICLLVKSPNWGKEGKGEREELIQSNLFLVLMKCMVCKSIFLLSSSDKSLWPYRYNCTSFCKRAKLFAVRRGIAFSAKVNLFKL